MSEFRRRLLMQQTNTVKSDDWCEYEYDEYASTLGYKLLLINDGSKVSKIEFEDGNVIYNPNAGQIAHPKPILGINKVRFTLKKDITSAYNLFYYTALIRVQTDIFRNCKLINDFSRTFYQGYYLTNTPLDEDGGELWERAGKQGYPSSINGTLCFTGCTSLPNYGQIPPEWKNY